MSKTNTVIAHLASTTILVLTLWGCGGAEERKVEYLQRAQTHFDAGNIEKSKIDTRNALQIDNTYVDARFLYAQIFEREQNWEQMVGNLQIVLEYQPQHSPARIKLATLLLANSAFEPALTEAQQILASEPNNADAHALVGAVNFRQGNNVEAVAAAHEALTVDPGNVSAIAVLSEVYKSENPKLALEIIERGIARQDDSTVFKLMQISVFEEAQDLQSVEKIYQSLIREKPDNLYFYYRFVTHLEKYEKHQQAEALLRDITQAKPDEIQLKLWLTQYLLNHRDLIAAEDAIRGFLNDDPSQTELNLGLVEILLAQDDTDAARVHLNQIIDLDDASELAQKSRYALAQIEQQTGNSAAANTLIEEMLDVEPENPDALLLTMGQLISDKKYDETVAQGRLVLRNRPNSEPALEMIAYAHAQAGSPDLALDNFRQILSVNPRNERALLEVARAAQTSGDAQRAIELASVCLRLNPENTEAAQLLIAAYATQGDLDTAKGHASELAKADSTKVVGMLLIGRIHQFERNFTPAIESYLAVLDAKPDSKEALGGLIASYRGQDNFSAARSYLEGYIAAQAEHGYALNLLGKLDLQQGSERQARENFIRATQAFPEEEANHIELGDLQFRQGQFDAAQTSYEKGLRLNPGNVNLMLRVAQMHEIKKDYQRAIDQYEQVLIADPNSVAARNNVAVLYSDRMPTAQNLLRAVTLMRDYANRDDPILLDTLGWVYYRLGDPLQAINYLSRSLEKVSNATVQYHLGVALLAADQHARAKELLTKAINAAGEQEWVNDAQVQLHGI